MLFFAAATPPFLLPLPIGSCFCSYRMHQVYFVGRLGLMLYLLEGGGRVREREVDTGMVREAYKVLWQLLYFLQVFE